MYRITPLFWFFVIDYLSFHRCISLNGHWDTDNIIFWNKVLEIAPASVKIIILNILNDIGHNFVLNVVTHRALPVNAFPDSESVNCNYWTVQTSTTRMAKMAAWRQRFLHNNVFSVSWYIFLKKIHLVSIYQDFHWLDNYFWKKSSQHLVLDGTEELVIQTFDTLDVGNFFR